MIYLILRHHYYSSFHLSDENMERYLRHIASIGSCFLHVYPSNGFNQHDTRRIQHNLGLKLDERLQFEIKLVDKIELSPREKLYMLTRRFRRRKQSLQTKPVLSK